MEVFWQKGFEASSLSDLTRAMGIAAPSLYAAFGSKDALFCEATEHYARRDGGQLMAAIANAPTARQAVHDFLTISVQAFSTADRPAGCMVVLSAVNAEGASEETCGRLKELRKEAAAAIEARLRAAIETGEIPENADVDGIARFYVTLQQGMSIQSRDGASREDLDGCAQAAMAAWEPLITNASRGGG